MGSEHRPIKAILAELPGRTDVDELLGTVMERFETSATNGSEQTRQTETVGCD